MQTSPVRAAAHPLLLIPSETNNVKAYFYARSHNPVPGERGPGVIAFCVPDLGFTYRAALRATPSELPYKALLSLLKFLESNRKVWGRQKLDLFTDCTPMVHQVSGELRAPASVRKHLGSIGIKKKKLGFSLHWVSEAENRARENIVIQPVAKPVPKLNFSSLQDSTLVQRAARWYQKSGASTRPKGQES